MVRGPGHAERILSYLNETKTGNVLNGRYLIEEPLGSGGMGSVYAARHVKLGTRLAIKVLLPELLSDADAIARFGREARAAAKIADENVVRILDVGQLESGAPYIVMEFLEGQDGAQYLKEHGRLSIDHAVDVMLQACAALSAAHARHVIHRDIKPSNLFFVPRSAGRPLIKMLDFGVSKIISNSNQKDSQVTKAGSILGSPGYVPPEQWFSSNNADKRSDIWSLGILFYEFLTGQVPFAAPSIPVLATQIAYEPPVSPRRLRDEIPAEVETIILRCLEKNPDKRFQDVAAMATALSSCLHRHQRVNGVAGNQPMRLGMAAFGRRHSSFPFSIRGAAVLGAVLAIVGIGALLHKSGSKAPPPPEGVSLRAPPPTPVPAAAPFATAPPAGESTIATERPSSAAPVARPKVRPAQRHSAQAAAGRDRQPSDARRRPAEGADPKASRCTPPYYFNAQGSRVFKIECL